MLVATRPGIGVGVAVVVGVAVGLVLVLPPAARGMASVVGATYAAVVGVVRRQVFDIPPLRLRVTEHRAQTRRCGCGHTTTAAFPSAATAPTCYGPGVRAIICYLAVYQHLPVDRCARLLADLLGAPVSTGTVAAVAAQAPARIAPAVAAIRDRLIAAGVLHADETGARVAGRLAWIHVASTALYTFLTVHTRRGTDATDAAGVRLR